MDIKELRKQLDNKLTTLPSHCSSEFIQECHQAYMDYHMAAKPDDIYVIPMEEMAELTQHLSKIIRGKEDPTNLAFLEELVDVQICIDNLRIACGVDSEIFEYIKDIKYERNRKRINNQTA